MTANTAPIFTITPKNPVAGKVTAADTGTDGTGANVKLIATAGANGSFIQRLMLQPISSSGSTTTSAAAVRLYINNGSTVGTAANNVLFKEWSLGAIAVNTAATTAAFGYEITLNFQLQATYTIYAGITAMAASTQWNIVPVQGDY